MFKRRKRGQSTLEYITVFVAIVAAIIAVAYNVLNPAMNRVITASGNRISAAASQFQSANINQ